jgi:sRNA-binding regulator protein Hfq
MSLDRPAALLIRHSRPCVCIIFRSWTFSREAAEFMSSQVNSLPEPKKSATSRALAEARTRNPAAAVAPFRLPAYGVEPEPPGRQAEVFYLQKQIQAQTPMVIVLEDGDKVEGCIEWYDRNALKVRGRTKTLVYKSGIKYMYKLGDAGQ